jgi:hypothetical protein
MVVEGSGLRYRAVEPVLGRLWRLGVLLRTEKPVRKHQKVFKGRVGSSRNLRSYHLHVLRPKGSDSLAPEGRRFTKYDEKLLKWAHVVKSKAQVVPDFLQKHNDRTFYLKQIVGL